MLLNEELGEAPANPTCVIPLAIYLCFTVVLNFGSRECARPCTIVVLLSADLQGLNTVRCGPEQLYFSGLWQRLGFTEHHYDLNIITSGIDSITRYD